jgi:hypothetical protein
VKEKKDKVVVFEPNRAGIAPLPDKIVQIFAVILIFHLG